MNRTIKFRAWDKDENKMINLSFECCDMSQENAICCHSDKEYYELMQYTGLKDKNGKEIYEGDIVKIYNYPNEFKRGEPDFDWRIFEVQWNQTNYAFNNCVIYSPFSRYNGKTLEDYDIEIIGNIYENPELLTNK